MEKLKSLLVIALIASVFLVNGCGGGGEEEYKEGGNVTKGGVNVSNATEEEPTGEWTTIKTFSGTGDMMSKSEPFHISSNRFRIKWEYKKSTYSAFGFAVYRVGEDVTTEIITSDEETGETYIYKGNDDFYLQFNIANVRNWTIKIQERV